MAPPIARRGRPASGVVLSFYRREMMDPRDFISIAIRLSNSQNEADLRSAISRAYYGAFHLAKQFLQDCGLRISRKELDASQIHRKVRYCLSESHNTEAMFAADKLKSLREQRNEADYDLDSTIFGKTGNVSLRVRAALEIVEALQRC